MPRHAIGGKRQGGYHRRHAPCPSGTQSSDRRRSRDHNVLHVRVPVWARRCACDEARRSAPERQRRPWVAQATKG